jgi:hypothetical protein
VTFILFLLGRKTRLCIYGLPSEMETSAVWRLFDDDVIISDYVASMVALFMSGEF